MIFASPVTSARYLCGAGNAREMFTARTRSAEQRGLPGRKVLAIGKRNHDLFSFTALIDLEICPIYSFEFVSKMFI